MLERAKKPVGRQRHIVNVVCSKVLDVNSTTTEAPTVLDISENFTTATLERSMRAASDMASTSLVALQAASPYISKFLSSMMKPVMINLIRGGKNWFI